MNKRHFLAAVSFSSVPISIGRLFTVLLFLLVLGAFKCSHVAADGPQNVLLVVNEDSLESLAIANHYIALRSIPKQNVVYLKNIRVLPKFKGVSISAPQFWQDIYLPIVKAIEERGLENQIDCIAYSAGFPNKVACNLEQQKYLKVHNKKFSKVYHSPILSLTGATFIGDDLVAKVPTFFDRHWNWYCRNDGVSRPFSCTTGWKQNADPDLTGKTGRRYRLSCKLAVVRPKASSLQDAIKQISRSAGADGTHPKGVFYFAKHKDPRSRTRQAGFPPAAEALRALGQKVEIGEEKMPMNQQVNGVTLGSPFLDWKKSGSKFVPGAFCDNFTSYGAVFRQNQTKLTHFLDHGAAMATGMVCEPYTIRSKIPSPFAHVHYVRGCTILESIYQTVQNPYEILIVGDPLCRPFARFPKFKIAGIKNGANVGKKFEISVEPDASEDIKACQIYIDGIFQSDVPAREKIRIETDNLGGGVHQLVVAVVGSESSGPTATKSIEFNVGGNVPKLKVFPQQSEYKLDQEILIQSTEVKANQITVWHNSRAIGKLNVEAPLKIRARQLGPGPVKLYATVNRGTTTVTGPTTQLTISAN